MTETQARAKLQDQWEHAVTECLAVLGELNTSTVAMNAAYASWIVTGAPREGAIAESFFGSCERSIHAEQAYDDIRATYDKTLRALLDATGQSSIARRIAYGHCTSRIRFDNSVSRVKRAP